MSPLDYREPHPRLPADGLEGREGKTYHAHPDLIAAANAALVIQRPLLLTGEAGCGKTDFAFAAASGLGDHPDAGDETTRALECYVRSDSRARDLLYHYDAIRRFGDAQHGGDQGRLIYNRTAGGVDQEGGGLHAIQCRGIDESV